MNLRLRLLFSLTLLALLLSFSAYGSLEEEKSERERSVPVIKGVWDPAVSELMESLDNSKIVVAKDGTLLIWTRESEIPEVPEVNRSYEEALAGRFGAGGTESVDFESMVEAGVTWKRITVTLDNYNLSEIDALVKNTEKAGMILHVILSLTEYPTKQYEKSLSANEFAEKAAEIVERYDGDGINDMPELRYPIKNYEIFNEFMPNIGPWTNWSFDDYEEYYRAAHQSIKEACSDCQIAPSSFVGVNYEFLNFLKEREIEFDFLSYHSYTDYLNVDELMEVLKELGFEDKPIWLTESQFGGMEEKLNRSEEEVAYAMVKSYVYALARGIDKVEPSEWEAHNYYPEGLKWSCLIDENRNKRKSFYAYKTLIEKIDGFESAEIKSTGDLNLVEFNVKGRKVFVAWGSGELKELLEGKFIVTDMYGNSSEKNADEIILNEELIYLESSQKGDLNGDGEVNVLDLVTLVNIILGKKEGEGDINGDGRTDALDLAELINIILGLPPEEQIEEKPEEQPGEVREGKPYVIQLESEYKMAEDGDGIFKSGQDADIVLSWFDFNYAEPLVFNHPMGIASDGKRLLLADTRNNRILIWNELPVGNEEPDLVLGQNDFYSNLPGCSESKLNWPVAVATDGKRIVVADTNNHRVLIWNEYPEKNGAPADIVLGQQDFYTCDEDSSWLKWPWAVWTNGKKLIVAATREGRVYVWNEFPESSNQMPDLVLTAREKFGTPRMIETDGESYLIIGDHNWRGFEQEELEGDATLIWLEFPDEDEEPDIILPDLLWGAMVVNNTLYGLAASVVKIPNWKETLKSADEKLEMIINGNGCSFCSEGGDGTGMIYVGNKTYISLYNGGRVVGFFGLPENRKPDFCIGSDDVEVDPFTDKYFFTDGGYPISDGESLAVLDGFNRRILVWKNIPDESGAKPDVIYVFNVSGADFEPISADIHEGKFYVIGRGGSGGGFVIWDTFPKGEMPEVVIQRELGGVDISEGSGIAVDDKYLYVTANGKLYVWRQPFKVGDKPIKTIEFDRPLHRVKSNGEKIVTICEHSVFIIDVNSIEESNLEVLEVCKDCEVRFNLPQGVFIGERLFVADTGFNRVLVWNRIPENESDEPDVVIGQESFESLLPLATRDGLFMPGSIWFDGDYLWVGEMKFSNRILRYS